MAYAKYSIIVRVPNDLNEDPVWVGQYEDKALAEAEYTMFVDSGSYQAVYLFLDQIPTKSWDRTTATGYWTDAYGVTRVVPTGEID